MTPCTAPDSDAPTPGTADIAAPGTSHAARPGRRRALQMLGAGAAAALAGPTPVLGQDDRSPISLLMGFGASMDYAARVTADVMRETLGRPLVPVPKLGVGGRLMLGELKRAAPDGRTLGFSTSSPFAIYPNVYTKLDYDPVADFTPILGVSWFDVGIAASNQTGAKTIGELVDWIKKQGGEAVFGVSPGTGSSSHFMGVALCLAAGVKMITVPYKETGQGLLDLSTGRIPILITGSGPMVEMHRTGKLRIVATSGDQRAPQTPEVPTLKESGVNLSFVAWAGVYGPAKMPADLVARMQSAVLPALSKPEIRDKLAVQGMVAQPMDGQKLSAFLAAERVRFAELVKASGYQPEAA